jgi:hypothetical protein
LTGGAGRGLSDAKAEIDSRRVAARVSFRYGIMLG